MVLVELPTGPMFIVVALALPPTVMVVAVEVPMFKVPADAVSMSGVSTEVLPCNVAAIPVPVMLKLPVWADPGVLPCNAI